nr:hypothetical protein CFP56_03046 [Quercus suber]
MILAVPGSSAPGPKEDHPTTHGWLSNLSSSCRWPGRAHGPSVVGGDTNIARQRRPRLLRPLRHRWPRLSSDSATRATSLVADLRHATAALGCVEARSVTDLHQTPAGNMLRDNSTSGRDEVCIPGKLDMPGSQLIGLLQERYRASRKNSEYGKACTVQIRGRCRGDHDEWRCRICPTRTLFPPFFPQAPASPSRTETSIARSGCRPGWWKTPDKQQGVTCLVSASPDRYSTTLTSPGMCPDALRYPYSYHLACQAYLSKENPAASGASTCCTTQLKQ